MENGTHKQQICNIEIRRFSRKIVGDTPDLPTVKYDSKEKLREEILYTIYTKSYLLKF